jgi:hypothetical protein
MRERRGSLVATAAAKVRREGILAALYEAPGWLSRVSLVESRLVALRVRRRVRHRRMGLTAVPPRDATIDVDPATITHLVPFSRFDEAFPRALLGTVRGGNWDRDPRPIEHHPKYRACRARVEDGTPWAETGIVDHLTEELEAADADTIEHGCGSRADLLERYDTEREALYRSLRDEGYDRSTSPVCCRVHIGRNGRLLFGTGGFHRFALSRLLGIESVPMQVLCRHADWQAVRETVAVAETADALPAGVARDHPDLREFDLGRGTERSNDGVGSVV